MRNEHIGLTNNKRMYIRLPDNMENLSVLKLVLPKEMAGKTLAIDCIPNNSIHIPFEKDAIKAENDHSQLAYFGDDEYWEPKEYTRTVVEGNPSCDYSECTLECHVVSCAVHQGFASDRPMKISYTRSDKMKG